MNSIKFVLSWVFFNEFCVHLISSGSWKLLPHFTFYHNRTSPSPYFDSGTAAAGGLWVFLNAKLYLLPANSAYLTCVLSKYSQSFPIFRMFPGMADHANSFINCAVQHHCMDSVHCPSRARKIVQLPSFNRITMTLLSGCWRDWKTVSGEAIRTLIQTVLVLCTVIF